MYVCSAMLLVREVQRLTLWLQQHAYLIDQAPFSGCLLISAIFHCLFRSCCEIGGDERQLLPFDMRDFAESPV
jgi:hypothetical protein